MSDIQRYIVGSIREYLNNSLSLDEFRSAFAGAYFHVRQNGPDDQSTQLMNELIGPFGEFSAGHKSEASLRRDLANAIRSFEISGSDANLITAPLT